ncbi:trypsin-like protease, partial [Basidiobolus meristosporus CBS 931.73]
ILTAAHCLVSTAKPNSFLSSVDPADLKVVVGSSKSGLINPMNVRSYVINPDFRLDTYSHDIALIQLDIDLTLNSTVQSIVIGEEPIEPHQTLVALGWGQNESQETSSQLQAVNLTTSSLAPCQSQIPEFQDHNGQFVCTAFIPGKDTCPGDSGGPL